MLKSALRLCLLVGIAGLVAGSTCYHRPTNWVAKDTPTVSLEEANQRCGAYADEEMSKRQATPGKQTNYDAAGASLSDEFQDNMVRQGHMRKCMAELGWARPTPAPGEIVPGILDKASPMP